MKSWENGKQYWKLGSLSCDSIQAWNFLTTLFGFRLPVPPTVRSETTADGLWAFHSIYSCSCSCYTKRGFPTKTKDNHSNSHYFLDVAVTFLNENYVNFCAYVNEQPIFKRKLLQKLEFKLKSYYIKMKSTSNIQPNQTQAQKPKTKQNTKNLTLLQFLSKIARASWDHKVCILHLSVLQTNFKIWKCLYLICDLNFDLKPYISKSCVSSRLKLIY